MLLCLVVIVVVFLAVIKEKLFNSWRNYTSDTFFDLKWYWKFCPTEGSVENLHSCCSKCSYQIYPDSNYSNTTYECDQCGYRVGPLNGSNDDIESKVRRSIYQKLRLNTWKSNNKRD